MTQPAGHAAGSCGSPGAFRTCGACCGVVASPNSALCSVQNSPCSGSWWPKRYKTLPACVDCAKSGHFGRAGRVLSRTCGEGGCAWRVLYRKWGRATCAGRVLSRTCGESGCAGRVLYRSGPARLLLGEFCRANRYCAVLVGDTAASRPVGVLRHAELFGGVSSACRRRVGGLDGVIPRLLAMRSQLGAVRRRNRRPLR